MSPSTAQALARSSLTTQILPVRASQIHIVPSSSQPGSVIENWSLELVESSSDAGNLHRAARELISSDIPVAFPTETVYGLGADATRSTAVRGIYEAKQRPSDNPLIVHIHSLGQVRQLLQPDTAINAESGAAHEKPVHPPLNARGNGSEPALNVDPVPNVYYHLIQRFWPGPLTLIMPNHPFSILAPEVTAGLKTFGVRMPRSPHALALIKLAGVPLAAPSANASTKPSPTMAEHVKHDLDGRISTIIDGGPCEVGLESTVVDGLCDPPAILRPGGVSIEEIRLCPGWEHVVVSYKDASESSTGPRAPGMKYRHYSPKAIVLLFEHPAPPPTLEDILPHCRHCRRLGLVRTGKWALSEVLEAIGVSNTQEHIETGNDSKVPSSLFESGQVHESATGSLMGTAVKARELHIRPISLGDLTIWDIELGPNATQVAQGVFAALRELDMNGVEIVIAEGLDDSLGDVAAAVMNRLRKAAMIKD